MEPTEFYHVIDRMDLPKVNTYGLTPKEQEDGEERLYVFRNLFDAKRYNKNRLGGLILRFEYKFYVDQDKKSGYNFIKSTIPTDRISVLVPGQKDDEFISFESYYRKYEEKQSESEGETKTASKLKRIASRI